MPRAPSSITRLSLSLDWWREPAGDPVRRILATGVFDLLHVGHVRFLAAARAAGTSLTVGVESDARVAARKGGAHPILPAQERCELLAALRPVDGVFLVDGPPDLFTAPAYAHLLRELHPAALALTAGDPAETGKREAARRLGAEVVVVPLVEGRSTTGLLARIELPGAAGADGAAAASAVWGPTLRCPWPAERSTGASGSTARGCSPT